MATAQSTATITGIDAIYYLAKDFDRARRFYEGAFDLKPTFEMIGADEGGSFVEYDLPDGTTFGLWGGGGKVMPFQPSNGILFAVDDLDAAVAALKARGIPIQMERETASCFMAMVSDTEGNAVFLHKRKTSPG